MWDKFVDLYKDNASAEYDETLFFGEKCKLWAPAQIISYNYLSSVEDLLKVVEHYPTQESLTTYDKYSNIGHKLGGDCWDSACLVPSGELIGVDIDKCYSIEQLMQSWHRYFKHNNTSKQEVYSKLEKVYNAFKLTHAVQVNFTMEEPKYDIYEGSFYVEYYDDKNTLSLSLLSTEDKETTVEFSKYNYLERNNSYVIVKDSYDNRYVIMSKHYYQSNKPNLKELCPTYSEVHLVDWHRRPLEEQVYKDDILDIKITYCPERVKNCMYEKHTVGTLDIKVFANDKCIALGSRAIDVEFAKVYKDQYSSILEKVEWVDADITYSDDGYDWTWFTYTYFNKSEEEAVAYQQKVAKALREYLRGKPANYWYETSLGIWLSEIIEWAGGEQDNSTEVFWFDVEDIPF